MKKIFKKAVSVLLSLLLTLPVLPINNLLAQDLNVSPTPAVTASTPKKQIIGYITQWDAWKATNAGLPAQGALNQLNIDYSKYTILNYSFFGVANDGSLHSGDFRNKNIYQAGAVQQPAPLLFTDIYSSWDLYLLFGDIEYVYYVNADIAARAKAQGFDVKENGSTWSNPSWNLYNQPLPMPIKKAGGAPGLLELGKQNGVKVMASIGGWSMCKHFPEMAADPVKRARFIEDCKRLIAMGFDGIDLDWEYVGPYDGMNFKGSSADYANFITLVKEIRAAIGPDKLITSCFSASTSKLGGFNWPEIDKYVDYYNFMTYDFNGGWSNQAGHNAPLYDYANAEYAGFSTDYLYQYLKTTNINMNKVNMGIPFYGRGVVTNGPADLNAPTVKRNETVQPDGPISTCADYTNWAKDVYDGTPNYSYIKQIVLAPNSGWTVKWDDQAKVPYATKGNFFLSYDNEESVAYKAQYIKDNNLAGAIVWNVFGDLEFGGTVTNYGAKLKKWSDVKSPLVNKINEVFNSGMQAVAAPTFSLASGQYPVAQTVTLSSSTNGAAIRYTTDGTEPTLASALYTAPLTIAKTTTLKAKAFKDGMYDSITSSATYTLPQETVATPLLSLATGSYPASQTVALSCETKDAIIRYTTDGTEPTKTSAIYSAPLTIAKTTTLKAKAFKEGMNDSLTASATYTLLLEVVATPSFSPAAGTYPVAQNVTLSCPTAGATIRYTADGSEPTATSPIYSSPINISKTTTLKAKAFKEGMNDSLTASALYTIALEDVAAPTFSPAAGTYNTAQNVTLNCVTVGATIRYTTDGTEPTTASPIYSSPINVSKTTTLKAKAFKTGMADSTTTSATYTIQGDSQIKPWAPNTKYVAGDLVSYNGKNYECRQPHTSLLGWEPPNVPALWKEYTGSVTPVETVATPSFSPASGIYPSVQTVTISCSTSGATIRYTTNGTEPTASSPLYSSALSIATTTTLKAKAFKTGMNDSATASATYTIQVAPTETVATPLLSPSGGTYTAPQAVTISCQTTGAIIRYTTDGTEPTASSMLYSSPINLSTTTTLKAKAFKTGMNDSSTVSATYTIQVAPIETVAAPTFSPNAGTFTAAQTVTISCQTSGATIRYTTDGTEPTATSTVYSSAINVSTTTTLKAKAFKTGMNDSVTTSATYTIEIGTVVKAWAPNTSYATGAIVSYNGKNYKCIQGHTSLPGWEPSAVAALWQEYTGAVTSLEVTAPKIAAPAHFYALQSDGVIKPWAPNTAYVKGDVVSYNGKNYECRQPHTTLLGWEPPVVPALWSEYTGSVTPVETVATPSLSPATGTYTAPQTVTLSCSTSGATITYTTDGTEPTASSTVYSSPITVSMTTTLKAKAFKTGMNNSSTASATYTIQVIPVETVSAPTFSPNGGSFTAPQTVTLTSVTAGATIRYTTNGSEPTVSSPVYTNPISINATTTLKAKAFKTGMNDSSTTSATYTIQIAPVETVAAPTFSPNGGTFTSAQTVTLGCATSGATIRYTTDGTEPNTSSPTYDSAINVSKTSTLKAKAFKTGMNDSPTTSATYTIQGTVVVKPWAAGTAYVKGDLVSYNGKNYECRQPHTALLGWEPINVPALWLEYTGAVTPMETVATPTFSLASGTYTTPQTITLNCSTSGATIRYTTDGTEPTLASAIYTTALNVAKTTTLKAKAFKTGMNDSSTISATYTLTLETVAAPIFSLIGGTYPDAQSITMSCLTSGALIRYTTDGTEPTATSTLYSGALTIAKTTTLKAKAFKEGMNDSHTVSATYTIGTVPVTNLPAHILTGYWQNFDNGAKCLKISDVPTSYNLICVSFADATATPGAISFTLDPTLSSKLGGYTKAQFIADIAAAKTKGQKVILSVGGEKGSIRVADAAAATNFANSAYALIQEYGFDGVDIDLENGVSATYMGSALRQLSAKVGPSLIIAMAPQTIDMQSTGMEYFKLALSIKDILTVVNMQYYNSGSMLGQDGKVYSQGSVDFLTALAAIQLENGLRPDQVGLGLPASPSGAGSGYINPTMVNTALNCLATGAKGGNYVPPQTYPGIRGAMTWSINWDASNGYNFANTVRPALDALPNGTTPTLKVETPTLSLASGTYTTVQTVTLTCTTPGATIRYTTNGTEPTVSSSTYTGPISLTTTTTLKAKAFKTGLTDSTTATSTYTINLGGPTSLQKRVLVGYWHTWGGGPAGGVPFVKLRDVNPNWDVINVSFAEPVSAGSTDGRMKFQVSGLTPDYTINDFKADIKLLQSQGKKVVLSIGGYEGYFSLTSPAAVNQFVSDIKGFINEYGFDGIDIDLEQSSVTFNSGADPDYKNPTSPKIVNMISAIGQICDAYGKDFILSWAPETFYMQLGYQYYGGLNANVDSRSGVYLPMIHALRDKTTYVHVQLYNSIAVTAPDGKSYSMGNAEATVAMCKMLLDGFNVGGKPEYFFTPLRADQVVIGVPASSSAAGSGQISNSALQQAFNTLVAQYPDLRGIMTWSINWDAYQNNNSFAISNGQYLDSKN